jgi:hypothetical protein
MKTLDQKKLNLLVHLAHIDGKFEATERDLLQQFITEHRLEPIPTPESPLRFSDFSKAPGKIELLYWALRVVQADGIIHPKELLFCKNLATKLLLKQEVIENFAHQPLPDLATFKQMVAPFIISENDAAFYTGK